MTKVYDNATDLITFARSSSGTALRRVGYGDELVVDGSGNWIGDFDVAADVSEWYATPSATVTWDTSQALSSATTAGAAGAHHNIATTAGKTYVVSVSSTSANSAHRLRIGNGSYAGAIIAETSDASSPTSFTLNFTAQSSLTAIYLRNTAAGTVLWDNVSVKEVIFDRPSDDLVLFDHPDDIPRIEYDGSDGSLKGLLIEEQRTNLVTTSTDISGGNWFDNGGVITENAVTAPDGTQTGSTYDTDGAYRVLRNVVSVSTGSTYTWSFYAKNIDATDAKYRVYDNTQAADIVAPTSYFSQINTSDWTRISVTFTVPAGCSQVGVYLTSSNNGGTVAFWGAQLEEGSFPTSYIPTSNGQKTRWPDIASIPVSAFGYNQDAGTVVVEFDMSPTDGTNFPRVWSLNSGAASNTVELIGDTGNDIRAYNYNGTTAVWNSDILNDAALLPSIRAALAFTNGDGAATINGGSVITSSAVEVVAFDALALGGNRVGAQLLNGHIKSLSYFPRRLTDAQLQELTA
jgi:hypothetical protein